MNRILYVARKAKGLSEKDVSKALRLEEIVYRKVEAGMVSVTLEMATALQELYDVPVYCFFSPLQNSFDQAIQSLEKQKELLEETPDAQSDSLSAKTHFFIAKMGLESLADKQKHMLLMIKLRELKQENSKLKEIIEMIQSR